mmetsp:Transcript_15130/g.34440  ORF Transcript_15130/g.34440 Transcript_15130/m.34440 type:complete len:305 (+) Transcript_15130:69-983(+)
MGTRDRGRSDRQPDGPPPADISTIVLTNFPDDCSWRELKNFCRFLPGFQAAHVTQSVRNNRQSLFVKFESPEAADEALVDVNGAQYDLDMEDGHRLRAEIARRDLEVRPGRRPEPEQGPPPRDDGHARGRKRERSYDDPPPPRERSRPRNNGHYERDDRRRGGPPPEYREELDDRRYMRDDRRGDLGHGDRDRRGDRDRGDRGDRDRDKPERDYKIDERDDRRARDDGGEEPDTLMWRITDSNDLDQALRFFKGFSGFVAHKVNDRIQSVFVKYRDTKTMEAAMKAGSKHGFVAEMARRNLNVD